MTDRKPNWRKWNLIDDVEVWKAIALSLDIDPDKVTRDGSDWMAGGGYVNHEETEFKDRLDIIKANYSKIDPTPKALSSNGTAYCHINISKFAKWAISVNWVIPPELTALASKEDEDIKPLTEKPLSSRTENNYLRLIFALAGNIKGFNYNKPYESAKLIIDATETKISQQTIAEYISKAHALDSKERG